MNGANFTGAALRSKSSDGGKKRERTPKFHFSDFWVFSFEKNIQIIKWEARRKKIGEGTILSACQFK
jgi:hypothetical protein